MDTLTEDEGHFACDECGEEFPSQSALDGHEYEGCWATAEREKREAGNDKNDEN